jgi:hypothetical protein
LALSFATFSFLAFTFLAFGFFAACSLLAFSLLAFGFFAACGFLAFSFLTFGFFAALGFSFAAFSFLALSFVALRFATFSFATFSFAPDGLAVLFDRVPAVGTVVCGLARFGGPAPFVAGVRRTMTCAVVPDSAVVVVRAIGLSMVPLGVSVAVASRLVPGAAAFLAVALPGMLLAIAAGHGAVIAVVLLQREQFGHGAGRGREHADKPDRAERGKKAAPSTIGRDEGAVRAIYFQFQSPSRMARYEAGVNFR